MKILPWFTRLLLVGYITSSFSMDLQNDSGKQRWAELAHVLPKLTTFEQRPVLKYGMHSFTSFQAAQKEVAFQEALKSDDSLALMHQVARPVLCEREDVRNGKPIVIKSKCSFPLAYFALGVLSKQAGYHEDAEHAFEQAVGSAGYTPHDEPVAYAAQCAQFLLRNQYDYAFRQFQLLQDSSRYYPSWQHVTPVLRNMFVDAVHMPVLNTFPTDEQLEVQSRWIAQDLASSDKKIRTQGLASVAALMQKHAAQGMPLLQAAFAQCGIPAKIEAMAKNNNGVASCIWAQMLCNQALQKDKESLFDSQAKDLFALIKKYAETGNTKSCAQKELMQLIISFADVVNAYHRKDFERAAKKCFEIYKEDVYTSALENLILACTGTFLETLATQGQLDACAWQALTRVVRDAQNKVITPLTITYCCEVVGQFIERATAEQLSGDSSVLLCTTLRKIITTCDSAHAKYALSRLLFVIDHVGREETGIKSNEGSALDEAFKYAVAAHKAGLVEAAPFVKALMLYRGIQGLYAQKKDADAVDRVFDLMAIDLPHKEKKLCDAFAHDSLRISGATGVARARAWRIAQLLDSTYEKDKELALKMACEVFGECMSLDFDAEPNETWHNKLRYYKEYKVVDKIGALYKVLTDEHVLAQSEYVLAVVSLLRALTTYQLLESSEQPAKELLLQTAVVLANKAYERAKKCKKGNDAFVTSTRLVAGACSFLIGRFYIYQKNMEQANLAIEVGAKLQNPQCMRMLAVKALDTAAPTKKMTQQEFDGHIATLHTAFEHGDLYAGELLAQHYFDGPQNSFVCGYWLPIDTQRAYNIALKVGVKSGQACRIIGYFDFCRALIDSKKKDTTGVVTNSIHFLIQAAQLECEQAYAHLLDMCTSPECTAEHKRSIVTFLEQKAAQKLPVALCAMGSLLLSNPQRNPVYVDQAISYFNEAARLSEDQFGHYELIELYTSDPEKYMQGTDIFKVYEHCMALLNTTNDIRDFGSQSLDYFGKVIAALHSFKGSDEDQQVAQRYFKNLVGRLRDVGVDVAHKDFTHEEFNKVVTSMGASSVIAAVPMSGGVTGNMEVSQEQRRAIEIPEDPRERLTYYNDVLIPTLCAEFDELNSVYKEVAPIARSSEVLAPLATQCLYALACNGCVPAVEQYVDMFIQSSNKKEQLAALEALYRCMPVLETFDAKTMQECGIFSVYQKHIAFVKHLADVTHNGHAALVVAFWYSLCNTLNIECDNQEQNKAMRYCKIAAQAGCTGGIYLWNKHQLLRGGTLSKAEFTKVLQALVEIKDKELSAAELLMELYAGRGKLPCGHTVAVNKKYAKKIALQIKDKSVPALQRLAIMAQEDKEYKKAILYKLEIVKRKRVLERVAFVELAQNCAVAHIYPDEVVEYLERKIQEGYSDARHPLGGLMAKRKQFDRAIELLNQVIEEGGQYSGHAHLEMAFVCIDRDWCGFSLQKALEHVEMGIRAIAVDQCNRPSGTVCVQTFAMEIIKLMFDALKAQKLALKQEAGDVLQRVTDLMQEHQYYNAQSVEWPLIFATVHCLIGSDYWLLRRYFVSALQMLQASKAREVDLEYIGNAVSIVLSKLQVDVLAAQKEGNSKRAEQLRANMQDLLGLIKKDKVIYYIIFPVEIEVK